MPRRLVRIKVKHERQYRDDAAPNPTTVQR